MFEDLVSDVEYEWVETIRGKRLHLTYKVNGFSWSFTFGEAEIGALSIFLKQNHPPTPAEIAARLVERWDRNTDLADKQWWDRKADLARHIAAALQAERARESADG